MNFSDYAAKIKSLGREITPDALMGTRALVEPLISDSMLDGINVTRDLQYGDHERNRLDVFTAESSTDLKPVLLFVHGGGFVAGDKHAEGSPFYSNIAAWAVNNGFAGVNMTYRLAPDHQWPAGIEDIRSAIEFIQQQGSEQGLDANRIFLMGQSAGGAHASGYIAHPEVYGNADNGLAGAILLSAVYDFAAMPGSPMTTAYLGDDESTYQQRSSLDGMLNCDLPLLVTMAQYDPPPFLAQTQQFFTAWLDKHEELPWLVHMLGQNHLSVALYLGLEGDLLGPQLKRFVEEHA